MPDSARPSRGMAWLLAARPKTLPASISPVILGCALAARDNACHAIPALLCFLVALLAQIAANFANDYFDFRKGADRDGRLGPKRAVAQGWIAPETMLRAALGTLGLAMFFGLLLLFYGSLWLIVVGFLIALAVLAYTAGPFPLAYCGLGDVCVLLFYGIIPVCLSYYVQAGGITWNVFLFSAAIGFCATNIIVVNNYRDKEQDKLARKNTTVVRFGAAFGRALYLADIVLAVLCAAPIMLVSRFAGATVLTLAVLIQMRTWRELSRFQGKELNLTLARTARNELLYALGLSAVLLWG